MSLTIFKNETGNATVNAKGINDGIIQVDISGVLDGADFITSYLDNVGVAVPIRDQSWLTSAGDVLAGSDGAAKYVQNRLYRFEIINAGGSTSISVSVSHEADNLEVI